VHEGNLVVLDERRGVPRDPAAAAAERCARRRNLLGTLSLLLGLGIVAAVLWPGSWPLAAAALGLLVFYFAALIAAARRRVTRPPRTREARAAASWPDGVPRLRPVTGGRASRPRGPWHPGRPRA
jgi:hypothetical protein